MTVTSAPIGSSGQSLDGFGVNANVLQAFRESVVITDPTDPLAAVQITSSQPIGFYGVPVWMQGTPGFALSGPLPNVSSFPLGTTQVFGQVSTFPTGTTQVLIQGTTSVFVVSSVPNVLAGTSQIFGQVSSFPTGITSTFGTNQLTTTSVNLLNPQTSTFITGQLTTTSVNVLNVSTYPTVSTFPTGQSSTFVANAPNVNVTNVPSVNVTSSLPFFVTQSSAPWVTVETASTAGGLSATTIALLASLNTTVIKGTTGQVYGIYGANVGSSQVFVRLYNQSTAALTIASTGVPLLNIGFPISSSPYIGIDLGVPFSAGITLLTQQQPYTASSSVSPTASTATVTILYK